ncbi:hypothetical protein [Metabacillus fastidiosus]|uniref:hypothetical protein n=1 Tax=Metabacillus fastidiosus TaxID=1458 RepID=UPI002DBCB2CC|nr:hypothetical protein [Metabacillus fastidiosus]MEC2076098.1 hypothetical protein [Metabacillus fastidiosus]
MITNAYIAATPNNYENFISKASQSSVNVTVMGPKSGEITVKLYQNGHFINDTFVADPSGISTTVLNIGNSSFQEGTVLVSVQHTDPNGKIQPVFNGEPAIFDKTVPTVVSIIAGMFGEGSIGLDTVNDAVIFESWEPLVVTDITGALKRYTDPKPDSGNGVGETSRFIQALDGDLAFNTSASGQGISGTWGLKSDTTGADIDISSGISHGWYGLFFTYKNIGSGGFASNILSNTYQYLIPNLNAVSVMITDLAGNRLSTMAGGTSQAVDYDDTNDVDVTNQ